MADEARRWFMRPLCHAPPHPPALSRGRRLQSPLKRSRDTEDRRENAMPQKIAPQKVLDAVRNAPGNRVKVAVSDIDGVLRGKYLHKDKFFSAVEGGFGFCDVVFGWDMNDQCYDNATLTGWHKGFPDAVARIDLGTFRNVPWDDDVPFFLGEFISQKNGKEVPLSICPRQLLKRVLKRAEKLGLMVKCGMEFEWFNFAET